MGGQKWRQESYKHTFTMGFAAKEAPCNVAAGILQLLRKPQVARLVKARLELYHHRHLSPQLPHIPVAQRST